MRTPRVAIMVAALVLAQTIGRAQITVSYNGGSGSPNIVDSTGAVLANSIGNTVEIGYFNTGFNIAANTNNISVLGANWHLFDSTTIRTVVGHQGSFAATSTTSFDSSFDNKTIDLWVFKTSDSLAPASDFHNVLEYGLFSSTVTKPATTWPWLFPPQGTQPPNNAPILTTSDVNATQGIFYFGNLANGGASLQLAPVPEPSTFALLGVGLVFIGIVARRSAFPAKS